MVAKMAIHQAICVMFVTRMTNSAVPKIYTDLSGIYLC